MEPIQTSRATVFGRPAIVISELILLLVFLEDDGSIMTTESKRVA